LIVKNFCSSGALPWTVSPGLFLLKVEVPAELRKDFEGILNEGVDLLQETEIST
jgi:hypothetical protein